jgi:homoserine dehydrogenase
VACDAQGATNLLGRGGSDLSALFIAYRLRAGNCRLLKDTDGLYEWDPKKPGPRPKCFAEITWDRALQLEKRVLQPKALAFAKAQNMAFSFACIGNEVFTKVGGSADRFREEARQPHPLRVTLLGLGTVGRGVYDRLVELPDRFEVVSVCARTPEKHRDVPGVVSSIDDALAVESDVVVELIGGLEPATAAIRGALAAGRHVVTANKDVIARRADEFDALPGSLRYSAAVGGAVPMIERTRSLAPKGIASLRGVVNGTTNYVIDRVLSGEAYAAVVEDAIQLGFAETDPSTDLDGHDAANKLAILACAALGRSVDVSQIDRTGIGAVDWDDARRRAEQGFRLRLVAYADHDGALRISPEFLPSSDLLAQTRLAGNALEITLMDGTSEVVRGLGAGRYPTTEAVIADLLELSRTTQTEPAGAVASRL